MISRRGVVTLTFQQAPGHCGIEGNELADAKPRSAVNSIHVGLKIPYSRSDLSSLLRSRIRGHRYKRLQGTDLDRAFRLPDKIDRRHDSILQRIRRSRLHWTLRAPHRSCGQLELGTLPSMQIVAAHTQRLASSRDTTKDVGFCAGKHRSENIKKYLGRNFR